MFIEELSINEFSKFAAHFTAGTPLVEVSGADRVVRLAHGFNEPTPDGRYEFSVCETTLRFRRSRLARFLGFATFSPEQRTLHATIIDLQTPAQSRNIILMDDPYPEVLVVEKPGDIRSLVRHVQPDDISLLNYILGQFAEHVEE